METLGYGTYLIINGFHLSAERLSDTAQLRELARELAQQLEPTTPAALETYSDDQGTSLVALMSEAYLTLHSYPANQCLSLRLFSRHGLDLQQPITLLCHKLGLRRYESHLSNHGRTISKDAAQRRRTVLGERLYTLLHLRKNVVF